MPGPPVVDAVPSSIRAFGNDFLVSMLSGFPFGAGTAQVRRVDRVTGASTPVITGLQTAIDVLPVTRGRGQFYVLEYSNNFLAVGPGRLLRIDEEGASPLVIASNLRTPTAMAIDPVTGDMLVTDGDGGRLLLVQIPR